MAEVERVQATATEAEKLLQQKKWDELDDEEGDDDDQEIGIKDKEKKTE
jgi:hypothetical protein